MITVPDKLRALWCLLLSCTLSLVSVVANDDTWSSQQPTLPQDRVLDQIWMYPIEGFDTEHYEIAVNKLIAAFESASSYELRPGEHGKAGIKIYTGAGAGLRTPPALVEAVILFLERRGFPRDNLFILDQQTDALWRAGYISSRADVVRNFRGVPILALDEGLHYDENWFYDSPLPSQYVAPVQLKAEGGYDFGTGFFDDRKSFLPMPLLLEVDFWINLPMISDHSKLGINGALANATLWNISNHYRFMSNIAGASAAIAEIAAIPELRAGWIFSIVTMEKIQFMGGPIFNSQYVRDYPEIYLSSNAVALDRLFLERINRLRGSMGFKAVAPIPPLFDYASSLGLGDHQRGSYEIHSIK